MKTPNADRVQLGMLTEETLTELQSKMINILPSDITKDQIVQLYLLMYPFIASEFVHRMDLKKYIDNALDEFNKNISDFNSRLDSMANTINTHTHTSYSPNTLTSTPPASVSSPSLDSWSTRPEDGGYHSGEDAIVETSNYTNIMKHRDPSFDAGLSNTSKSVDVVDIYSSNNNFVPFDMSGDKLITDDGMYIKIQ